MSVWVVVSGAAGGVAPSVVVVGVDAGTSDVGAPAAGAISVFSGVSGSPVVPAFWVSAESVMADRPPAAAERCLREA